jgi:hypothetical protein
MARDNPRIKPGDGHDSSGPPPPPACGCSIANGQRQKSRTVRPLMTGLKERKADEWRAQCRNTSELFSEKQRLSVKIPLPTPPSGTSPRGGSGSRLFETRDSASPRSPAPSRFSGSATSAARLARGRASSSRPGRPAASRRIARHGDREARIVVAAEIELH